MAPTYGAFYEYAPSMLPQKRRDIMRRSLNAAVLLTLLVLLSALPVQGEFSDMPAGSWYREAVTLMAEEGLLSGYPDGSFRPDASITAAEFVTITARCAGAAPVLS